MALVAKKSFTFLNGGPTGLLLFFFVGLGPLRAGLSRTASAVEVALAATLVLSWIAFGFAVLGSRVRVAVGTDGLRIRKRNRDRFVPYAEIERLEHSGSFNILLKPHGGRAEQWSGLWGTTDFLETARLAMDAYRRTAAQRQNEGPAIGVRIATEMNGHDYRQAAPPTDLLVRIAEDPTEPLDARLAATRALRDRPDLTDLARIRVAAEETASDALRAELDDLARSAAAPRRETRP